MPSPITIDWPHPNRSTNHHIVWRRRKGGQVNILSIDFDYWYLGQGPGVGHCGYCVATSPTCGLDRPDPSRFPGHIDAARTINYRMIFRRVAPNTPVYVTESHAQIVTILEQQRQLHPDHQIAVWNVDEHDDIWGEWQGYMETHPVPPCGGWVDWSVEKGWLDEYWWATDRQHLWQLNAYFPDVVFVCLSSPYTPSQADKPFITFVRNLEKRSGTEARVFGHRSEDIRKALAWRKK